MKAWRNLRRALLAARWAFSNADALTGLRCDLKLGAAERNSHGRTTRFGARCHWMFSRYLSDLPID